MKIITKYMLKQLLLGFILITSGLLLIVWLSQSLRLFQILLESKVSIWLFVQLTLMLVPSYLTVISPIALFAVTLYAYNKMITDRELTILRAAGMSAMDLAKPVFIVGTIFTILGFYISLVLVPKADANFREFRWKIQHDVSHLLLQPGEFTNLGRDATIFIQEKGKNGELFNIFLHDKHSPKSKVTVMAKQGEIVYQNGTPKIGLIDGSRQEYVYSTGRFSVLRFDSYNIDFGGSKKEKKRNQRHTEMSFKDLMNATKDDFMFNGNFDKKSYNKLKVEAAKRIVMPILNFAFMLIAAAGLLTGNFNRQGHGKRVVCTILVMAFFEVFTIGLSNRCTIDLGLLPVFCILPIIPLIGGIYVIKHAGSFKFKRINAIINRLSIYLEKLFEKVKAMKANKLNEALSEDASNIKQKNKSKFNKKGKQKRRR
ncbi:MAG: LPS export ABC transporter permease LptF [Alphaproteobacteria bacterium]|nr:LPS export ABC transporter permease LptF [Alphaproteobacteria bacterium]